VDRYVEGCKLCKQSIENFIEKENCRDVEAIAKRFNGWQSSNDCSSLDWIEKGEACEDWANVGDVQVHYKCRDCLWCDGLFIVGSI
jgi:hypothetical protein